MAVIKNDTFTVGSDTTLNNHTSDSGGGWTLSYATALTAYAATDSVGNTAGSVRNSLGSETPASADYYAQIGGATLGGTAISNAVGVTVRFSSFFYEANGYALTLQGNDGWRIARYEAGTGIFPSAAWYDLGYIAANSITGSTELTLKLQAETIDASTVRVTAWIDHGSGLNQVAQIDDTDATRVTAVNKHGIWFGGSSTARISSFYAADLAGAEATATPGAGAVTVAGQAPTIYIPPRRMTLDVLIR